ncbi:unnamed protein product [Nippostrongylus brasiliensis]|uniref:Uncharacterized protein n=1 Tax=Nippostrongylus brasiliensis TaxID=27835 RepID=A0A158R359_NIPBR|nr:unnamed protein product [Nippostrongylus brasiliensis]
MLSYPQVLILYFALFSLMQVRERMADEKLKEQYEYLALFERYAKHLGDDMALRARNIWRQLCASNDSCEIIPPFKRESYYAKFCEDCVGDVKCALRTAFEYSQRRAVGDFNADSYLFWHLSPQNWRCEFRDNVDNSKLVHYSSNKKDKLVNDLRELLSDANVHDSDIDVITSQIANGTTGHATNHLPQREEYSKQMQNDEFKRLLVKVYFWDYVLFNFPLPDVEI